MLKNQRLKRRTSVTTITTAITQGRLGRERERKEKKKNPTYLGQKQILKERRDESSSNSPLREERLGKSRTFGRGSESRESQKIDTSPQANLTLKRSIQMRDTRVNIERSDSACSLCWTYDVVGVPRVSPKPA